MIELLEIFPFSCRKAIGGCVGPFFRELIVPFGGSGDVALFESEGPRTVTVLAAGYQRQEDYHLAHRPCPDNPSRYRAHRPGTRLLRRRVFGLCGQPGCQHSSHLPLLPGITSDVHSRPRADVRFT